MSDNKQCPAFLGVHIAERVLSKVFKDVREMPYGNEGFDFICNKGKKIDVKSSCINTRVHHNSDWGFHINKNKIADFFLCLAFDNREDLNPLYIWLIPSKTVNNNIKISTTELTLPKWNKYKLNIDAVTTCCNTLKSKQNKLILKKIEESK